jgi:hypothetical protein
VFLQDILISYLGCIRNNSQSCLNSLETIRDTFGLNSTCSCNVEQGGNYYFKISTINELLDKFDACIKFRTEIWSNPCETAFVEDIEQISPARNYARFTRNSEQILRLKKEFNEIRANPITLSSTSCTTALFELCLKHISCRELWKLFRQECAIDAQNNCHMVNKYVLNQNSALFVKF